LITGASRGIGRSLLEEALNRGAKRVYAGTRQPFAHSDERVMPMTLDVTNAVEIQATVGRVESLDILVNNAGVDLHDDLSDRAGIDRHLAVNLFGTQGVTQAFLPLLARCQGAIVKCSVVAGPCCRTVQSRLFDLKAAAFSLSQSLRALLTGRGVKVHVVMPGPVETDMSSSYEKSDRCRRGRIRSGRAVPHDNRMFCSCRRWSLFRV
jgi:NAD(P)-dependent dehydrogenase (short-subunit alcohol dehydrogenase family)